MRVCGRSIILLVVICDGALGVEVYDMAWHDMIPIYKRCFWVRGVWELGWYGMVCDGVREPGRSYYACMYGFFTPVRFLFLAK
jgi:hypothetical protein